MSGGVHTGAGGGDSQSWMRGQALRQVRFTRDMSIAAHLSANGHRSSRGTCFLFCLKLPDMQCVDSVTLSWLTCAQRQLVTRTV